MIVFNTYIGNVNQNKSLIEEFDADLVDRVVIDPDERKRSRIRAMTESGTEVGIVPSEETGLKNGDVLAADDGQRLVVEFERVEALIVELPDNINPHDIFDAIKFGHMIGNRHWSLRIVDDEIQIPLSGDRSIVEDFVDQHLPEGFHYRYRDVEYEPTVQPGHTHDQ